jgi:hypothetical protein
MTNEHLRGYDVAQYQKDLLTNVSRLVKDLDLRKWAVEMALKDGGDVISRADAIYKFLIAEINGSTREEYLELSEIIAQIESGLGRTPLSPEEFLRFVTKRHIAFGVEELRASLVKRQLFALRFCLVDDADPDAYAQKIADEIARRDLDAR